MLCVVFGSFDVGLDRAEIDVIESHADRDLRAMRFTLDAFRVPTALSCMYTSDTIYNCM